MILLPIFVFGLGLIIGSFLNVVILRLNTGRSISKGRSKCPRCSKELAWYELVPVFSFLGLRGKCKSCDNPISFQYPIVELLTGILFVLLYTNIFLKIGFSFIGLVSYIYSLVVACLMIVILFYDFRHKIIPDKVVYPFIGLTLLAILLKSIFIPSFAPFSYIFAGFLFALPLFLIWFFSKGNAMGFGDVKLALGMGFALGVLGSISTFVLSFWIGAVFGMLLLGISKEHGMKSQVPFAPFMIIAFFIVAVLNFSILNIFSIWQ